MRSAFAACFVLVSVIGLGVARAAECPPDALGVSRTLVVDPSEHPRVGSAQYPESLPLKDHEVVLTFDDGPLPAYTNRILDTLASECVKATFFMVGRMVQAYPATVRRVYNEGHTVANHSLTHPFTFHKMSVDHAAQEIEGGFDALRAALGDPRAVAPFFRFPGLLRQTAVEQYLAAHNVMAWSVDVMADDWTHINNHEIARRAISRLEARGKGILLLHDIHAATALALPDILKELKARGFKIVHVVPATPDRPETVAEPELWAARHGRETNVWPRVLPVVGAEPAEAALAAPAPASFGIEFVGSVPKVALAQTFERQAAHDGDAALPAMTAWPNAAPYAVPVEAQMLPVPASYNFKYSRPSHVASPSHIAPAEKPVERHRIAARRPARGRATAQHPFGWFFGSAPARQRAYGHQLSVARHPANLATPQVR